MFKLKVCYDDSIEKQNLTMYNAILNLQSTLEHEKSIKLAHDKGSLNVWNLYICTAENAYL